MDWKNYEKKVYEYFQKRFPQALIKKNIKLPGNLTHTKREIDILIETQVYGFGFQIAIECKNWNHKLDIEDVGAFIDKLKDVGITKGIMISKYGYSKPAHQRARSELHVQLQVLNFENLPEFYGFWGVAYRGDIGAIISAPNGWVVNSNIKKEMLIDMLCLIHPCEFSPEESGKNRQFMYFNLLPIRENSNLRKTFEEQDFEVNKKYPESKIKYWMENIDKGQITFRQIDYFELNYTEFTAGFESDCFYGYLVYAVPKDYNADDIARLKYVIEELHLLRIAGIDPTNSHKYWQKIHLIRPKRQITCQG